MKKNLLMALVAVMALAQNAHAAGAKEGKDALPDAVKGREVKGAKEGASKSATHGADAATRTALTKNLRAAAPRMNPDQVTALSVAMGVPAVKAAVEAALVQSKTATLSDLAAARLEALANVKKDPTSVQADALATLDSNAKLEQAYDVLAVNAGEAAKGWTPELRENLTFLLQTANGLIAQGRTKAEAMTEANAILAKPKSEGGRSVRLNLDDVNKWCNK